MPEILVLLICHRWALHLWRIEPELISEAASNDGGKHIFIHTPALLVQLTSRFLMQLSTPEAYGSCCYEAHFCLK
jgi:hypothetical protein